MTYNFNDVSSWKPLFGKSFPKPELLSIQPPLIKMNMPSRQYLSDLEISLEKTIIRKIEGWRQGHVTRWNR